MWFSRSVVTVDQSRGRRGMRNEGQSRRSPSFAPSCHAPRLFLSYRLRSFPSRLVQSVHGQLHPPATTARPTDQLVTPTRSSLPFLRCTLPLPTLPLISTAPRQSQDGPQLSHWDRVSDVSLLPRGKDGMDVFETSALTAVGFQH